LIKLNTIIYTPSEILRKRVEVSKMLLANSSNIKGQAIAKISTQDLNLLFDLYDEVFFNNWFKRNFKGKMIFSLSSRMTRSAGKTLCPKNISKIKQQDLAIEIRIGTDFFFQYDEIQGEKKVCGIPTDNALQALQLVFEHEICHGIEFINYNTSDCSKERFKAMAKNLLGHTESHHKLPTYRQIAGEKYGLEIGDMVTFTYGNKKTKGIIYNINKRATVMVRDKNGTYADRQGNRYVKYYVPLELLK
jgi:hypothetical protein